MEKSKKRIWTTRFIALFITSVAFAALMSSKQKQIGSFDYKLDVRANKAEAETIVRTIESLNISDVYIHVKESSRFERNPDMITNTFSAFVGLGMLLGIYHLIYCLVNAILNRLGYTLEPSRHD